MREKRLVAGISAQPSEWEKARERARVMGMDLSSYTRHCWEREGMNAFQHEDPLILEKLVLNICPSLASKAKEVSNDLSISPTFFLAKLLESALFDIDPKILTARSRIVTAIEDNVEQLRLQVK